MGVGILLGQNNKKVKSIEDRLTELEEKMNNLSYDVIYDGIDETMAFAAPRSIENETLILG